MSRDRDVVSLALVEPAPVELPVINWSSIGHTAPKPHAKLHRQTSDALPAADVVVITWTNAEWSALDHVFANSSTKRKPGLGSWDTAWSLYNRDLAGFTSDDHGDPLWGKFRVVTVQGVSRGWNVLLFHANAHLQYQPYIAGLRAMVQNILTDTQPDLLFSIGTAGGAALSHALGDPVVTNAAELLAGAGPNVTDPANGETFTCTTWYPPNDLYTQAQTLMFPLSQVVTMTELQSLFSRFSQKQHVGTLTLADLINPPLDPANLGTPTVHSLPGIPLNTSCDFGMAPGSGTTQFSAYEEDDAVVGQVALQMGVKFAFIRNVSDPVIPDTTAAGAAISQSLRKDWAGVIYDRYGMITAYNGALATWAAIAAG